MMDRPSPGLSHLIKEEAFFSFFEPANVCLNVASIFWDDDRNAAFPLGLMTT
jgi:hypothetical protein